MLKRIWDEKRSKEFRKRLFQWYHRNGRKLPWREDPSPYKVWISEIMLQQTQTSTVLRYYDRFLSRFPDITSLAQAPEPEVLEFWSGLGYYCRARNLHKAAKKIVELHKTFPEDFSSILALPGIGRYTAGAICSIAFNQPYPVVDGNVRRVITRLRGIRHRVPESFFWDSATSWISARNPSDFNQGMMELGALLCTPLQPRCADCPVCIFCEANRLGIQRKIPKADARPATVRIQIVVLVLEKDGKLLLSALDRKDLIPGNWGLPWRIAEEDGSPKDAASALCKKVVGREIRLEPGTPIRHTISNFQISAVGFRGKMISEIPRRHSSGRFRWEGFSSAEGLMTSSLFRKILAKG